MQWCIFSGNCLLELIGKAINKKVKGGSSKSGKGQRSDRVQ